MMSILVIAEHDNATLNPNTFNTLEATIVVLRAVFPPPK
jgi:hypothetical protein